MNKALYREPEQTQLAVEVVAGLAAIHASDMFTRMLTEESISLEEIKIVGYQEAAFWFTTVYPQAEGYKRVSCPQKMMYLIDGFAGIFFDMTATYLDYAV